MTTAGDMVLEVSKDIVKVLNSTVKFWLTISLLKITILAQKFIPDLLLREAGNGVMQNCLFPSLSLLVYWWVMFLAHLATQKKVFRAKTSFLWNKEAHSTGICFSDSGTRLCYCHSSPLFYKIRYTKKQLCMFTMVCVRCGVTKRDTYTMYFLCFSRSWF